MTQDLAEMALEDDIADDNETAPETVPVPRALVPHLSKTAILLDIDGTLLDLMPTPREVWVPPGLVKTLSAWSKEPMARWRWSAAVRSTTSI
jgi:trehalose 6-phosphate phosphatase